MKKTAGVGLIGAITAITIIFLCSLWTWFDIDLETAFVGATSGVVIILYILACAKITGEMKYGGL